MDRVIECVASGVSDARNARNARYNNGNNIYDTLMPNQMMVVIDNLVKIGDYAAAAGIIDVIWNAGYDTDWTTPDAEALIDYILNFADTIRIFMFYYMKTVNEKGRMLRAGIGIEQPGTHKLYDFIMLFADFMAINGKD